MFSRCLLACALFCAVALVAPLSFGEDAGKASSSAKSKDKSLEQELLKLNEEMIEAELNGGNIPTLERLYTEDYTHTHTHEGVETKAEYINRIKTSKQVYSVRDMTDLHVRFYGTTAIINGHMHTKNLNGESNRVFMDVWVKQGGKWRVAAWVISRSDPLESAAAGNKKSKD